MDRWWYAAPLIAALLGCPQPHPQPPQPPEPTPTPTPAPTPTPTPTPTPEPTPLVCTLSLEGQPVARAYKLYPRVCDFTPLIYNPERCQSLGMPRMQCPTAPDEHPQRYVCEVALIGGPGPNWEFVRDSGDLRWVYEDDEPLWKARIIGIGAGRIRACYPNGKACSDWIELAYTE